VDYEIIMKFLICYQKYIDFVVFYFGTFYLALIYPNHVYKFTFPLFFFIFDKFKSTEDFYYVDDNSYFIKVNKFF